MLATSRACGLSASGSAAASTIVDSSAKRAPRIVHLEARVRLAVGADRPHGLRRRPPRSSRSCRRDRTAWRSCPASMNIAVAVDARGHAQRVEVRRWRTGPRPQPRTIAEPAAMRVRSAPAAIEHEHADGDVERGADAGEPLHPGKLHADVGREDGPDDATRRVCAVDAPDGGLAVSARGERMGGERQGHARAEGCREHHHHARRRTPRRW